MADSLLTHLNFIFRKLGIEDKAQGLIEYALIILLVVIVVIAVLGLLGVQVGNLFNNVTDAIPGVD